MGLLDDLRQQAEDRKTDAEKEQERQQRLRRIYEQEINPKLLKTYRFLRELTDHLNYLKPEINVSYELPVYGIIDGYKQGDYNVTANSDKEMTEIKFRFTCAREKNIQFRNDKKADIDKINDYLLSKNIKFHCKKEKNDKQVITAADFNINGTVNILFQFKANIKNSTIDLAMSNIDDFGLRTTTLKPSSINDDFLDRLGKYILRKEHDFFSLKISEEEKQIIRKKLQAEKKRLEHELHSAEDEARRKQDQKKEEKSLKNIFRIKRS